MPFGSIHHIHQGKSIQFRNQPANAKLTQIYRERGERERDIRKIFRHEWIIQCDSQKQ